MRDRLIELLIKCEYIRDLDAEYDCCAIYELVADYLLANGVIVPPCKIGDEVFYVLSDEDEPIEEWCVESETVTEVGESGIWASGFIPPKDDLSLHREWEELGSNLFLTLEEAENEFERRKIAKQGKK